MVNQAYLVKPYFFIVVRNAYIAQFISNVYIAHNVYIALPVSIRLYTPIWAQKKTYFYTQPSNFRCGCSSEDDIYIYYRYEAAKNKSGKIPKNSLINA